MNYKSFIPFGFFLLILPTILAQTPEIDLTHVGYGETQRDVVFSIRNTGEVELRDITLLIDGEVYRIMRGVLGPEKSLKKKLTLEPGDHLIEVRTSEGAYDSLDLTVSDIVEKPPVDTDGEEETYFEKNKLYIGAGVLIVILVIGIWLLTKKSKPAQELGSLQ